MTTHRIALCLATAAAVALLPAANACAESAVLVIGSVEVRGTKKDGKTAWDIGGGAPDLIVSVERTSAPKGEKHLTAVRMNTLDATLNSSALDVDAGDEIEIRVLDDDVSGSDEIGKFSFEVTREFIKSGEARLEFDQVKTLVLRLRK
jgi:hypothetical protein